MSSPHAATLNTRAALASVAVAAILGAMKLWAAWRTGSVAMLGSLADTGLDLIASLVTLVGVRVAALPPDTNHRFGHGKAEALAALFQVSLISVAAVMIIVRSVDRLTAGAAPQAPEAGIAVSVAALALTFVLIAYQRRVLAETGSLAIHTDRMHYQSDLLLNGSVIAALALDGVMGIHGADPLMGVGIGVWLGFGAWKSANSALDQLMDREWPLDRREAFLAVASSHPEIHGIHDMRTRTSGSRDFVQFHIWVDPDMSVAEAHRVVDEVEARLGQQFPGVEILIHADPTGHLDDGGPLAGANAEAILAEEKADLGQ